MSISRFFQFIVVMALLPLAAAAQALDATKIDSQLGRSGQRTGDVYKVGFARSELQVSVHGLAIKPGLALGSWAAFSGTDASAMVMGDLVLLEDEVNPVMDKLKSAGFEITGIHNHLADETPHVMYMHYMGHGPAAQLATSLRTALIASKTPFEKPTAAEEPPSPPAWVDALEKKLGRKGAFKDGVLAYGIARSNQVTMDGMIIAPVAGGGGRVTFLPARDGGLATAPVVAD